MSRDAEVSQHRYWLQRCIERAEQQSRTPGGGPFAALVVSAGELVAEGVNQVTGNHDPTAHAEVVAIRNACARRKDFQLQGCVLYSSCEPCPMCLGAIYWARPEAVYYAATHAQAARAGFDDSFIYEQIPLPGPERSIPFHPIALDTADVPFDAWRANGERRDY